MSMTLEDFTEWLVKLREEGARQCKGSLARVDAEGVKSHCCLGVYIDKVKGYPAVAGGRRNDDGVIEFESPYHHDSHGGARIIDGLMPLEEMDTSRQGILTSMNDGGKSLAEIADYLETKGLDWVNGGPMSDADRQRAGLGQ